MPVSEFCGLAVSDRQRDESGRGVKFRQRLMSETVRAYSLCVRVCEDCVRFEELRFLQTTLHNHRERVTAHRTLGFFCQMHVLRFYSVIIVDILLHALFKFGPFPYFGVGLYGVNFL